jgi:hypothetical protein
MPYATVTLTSASTNTSPVANLNWIGGKPTTATVLATSVSSGAFTLQYTLDDLQRVPSTLVAWFGVSSAIGQIGTIFSASGAYPDGVTYTFPGPIAGLRLFSSAANNVNNGPISLMVLQGEGW